MDREIVAFLTGKDGDEPRHLMAWQMALALASHPDDFDNAKVAYSMTDKFITKALDEMEKENNDQHKRRQESIAYGVKVELERQSKAQTPENS
jgi:hypothetical protein